MSARYVELGSGALDPGGAITLDRGDCHVHDDASDEAAAFYRRALDAARHCDDGASVRAQLEESLAAGLEQSGLYVEARAALRRARRLVSDPADHARLLLADGRIEEATGRYSVALGRYSRATRWLDQTSGQGESSAIKAQLVIERAGIRNTVAPTICLIPRCPI